MDIASMVQTGDDATIIQAVEMIGNDAVVLGSIPVTGKGSYRISFKPTGSSVQLWILGAYDIVLKPTCYTYPVTTQETYLVDICDENKDRYRFGFNGQEKVNELAGIGNHNTALFWEYDTRTGRRWERDPVDYPWQSDYTTFDNTPILKSDPLGLYGTEKQAQEMRSKAIDAGYSVGNVRQDDNGEYFFGMTDNKGELSMVYKKTNFEQQVSEVSSAEKSYSNDWFGGSGQNVWQAAMTQTPTREMLYNRSKVQGFETAMKVWGAAGASPFLLIAGIEAGPVGLSMAGRWAFNNLVMNGRKFAQLNASSAAGDLTYQIMTKEDYKDINFASVGANMFLGPLPAAVGGYTINISGNSISSGSPSSIFKNPLTRTGMLNIAAGTAGNYLGGKGADYFGRPIIKIGSSEAANIMSAPTQTLFNAAGNAGADAVVNTVENQ